MRANQTMLVDFETPWCAPCQRMKPCVDALAKARGLFVVHVDIDASPELAARDAIVGVLVLVVFKDGAQVWRHAGELDEGALAAAVPVL